VAYLSIFSGIRSNERSHDIQSSAVLRTGYLLKAALTSYRCANPLCTDFRGPLIWCKQITWHVWNPHTTITILCHHSSVDKWLSNEQRKQTARYV